MRNNPDDISNQIIHVTLADPDGYYTQSVEGILFTCFIGTVGFTMILVSFYSIFFEE